jgi:hypothetical protein
VTRPSAPHGAAPVAGKVLFLEPFNEALTVVAGGNLSVEGIDLSGKVIAAAEKAVVLDGIAYRAES